LNKIQAGKQGFNGQGDLDTKPSKKSEIYTHGTAKNRQQIRLPFDEPQKNTLDNLK